MNLFFLPEFLSLAILAALLTNHQGVAGNLAILLFLAVLTLLMFGFFYEN